MTIKQPVRAVIGGGILAAWKPFWALLSTLSTFDFMRTASGGPSIGAFFLPKGLADLVSVLGILTIVGAVIAIARQRNQPPRPEGISPSAPSTEGDPAQISEVERQFARLSPFEKFALSQLLLKSGMTGEHFADDILAMGFPFGPELDRRKITDTFDGISQKTTFLNRDFTTGHWSVKGDLKAAVTRCVEAKRPFIG